MAADAVRRVMLSVAVASLLLAPAAFALEVPFLSGRVNDEAGILGDAFEAALEERLRNLEEETGAQVAVLTIQSLEGDPLEDFSIRVAETWKLGREGADDGVLILIAREERRMRIEVGYGLEGVLTDAQSGRIIDHLMAPRFRAGDFDGGVGSAVDAISAAIRGEPVQLPEESRSTGIDPGALIFFLLFGLPFISSALSAKGAAGWIVGFFLTPFFFAFTAAILGVKAGVVVALIWLVAFGLLRLVLPKRPVGGGSSSGRGAFWGPFVGGSGGGGFSGGGFSGGGGSFGGGGASGGW